MDHFKILKRSFSITRDYRALWVFGILLALTTAGGSANGGNNGTRYQTGPQDFLHLSPQIVNSIIIAAVALACVIIILAVVSIFVRYISQTALIKMVDQYEVNNEKLTWRQGFRLGWSRTSLRLFLMDLLLGLSGFIIVVLLLGIAAAPLLVWFTDSTPARVLGTVLTVGMAVLVIGAAIIVSIILSLLIQFFRRAVVLENQGVLDGLRRGLERVRQRLGDVVVMGLILFGLHLAWIIVMIPVFILLLLAATLIGGLPALLVWAIVGLFTQGAVPWIVAGVVGAPIFILVIAVPTLFLNGLKETYFSTTWTLTYRELLALEVAKPPVAPEPTPPVEVVPPAEITPADTGTTAA